MYPVLNESKNTEWGIEFAYAFDLDVFLRAQESSYWNIMFSSRKNGKVIALIINPSLDFTERGYNFVEYLFMYVLYIYIKYISIYEKYKLFYLKLS